MKISVPKDVCILNMIADMGEASRNAWFFLDHNCKVDLFQKANDVVYCEGKSHWEGTTYALIWEATEKYPKTKLVIELFTGHEELIGTWAIKQIVADDIAFKKRVAIPEEVYLFEKEIREATSN